MKNQVKIVVHLIYILMLSFFTIIGVEKISVNDGVLNIEYKNEILYASVIVIYVTLIMFSQHILFAMLTKKYRNAIILDLKSHRPGFKIIYVLLSLAITVFGILQIVYIEGLKSANAHIYNPNFFNGCLWTFKAAEISGIGSYYFWEDFLFCGAPVLSESLGGLQVFLPFIIGLLIMYSTLIGPVKASYISASILTAGKVFWTCNSTLMKVLPWTYVLSSQLILILKSWIVYFIFIKLLEFLWEEENG